MTVAGPRVLQVIGEDFRGLEIFARTNEDGLPWKELERFLAEFEQAVDAHDVERIRELLLEAVKGFVPQCDIADLVSEENASNASPGWAE